MGGRALRLPAGATYLLNLRTQGKRPAGHVVVTDDPIVRRLNMHFGVYTLLAEPGVSDFRCVHGLPVIVWCLGDDVLGLVESVCEARPSELGVMTWEACRAFPKAFLEAA